MENTPPFTRPPFLEALEAWKALLRQRALPQELVWVFDENLCFEREPQAPQGFRLGFQSLFSPPPADAEQIAYYYFADFQVPLVWYRLGSAGGKSVCLLLCDRWFEGRRESREFVPRLDWGMLFRPGGAEEIEEIRDRARWENRLLRDRPLHDLDFCMSLQAVRELIAHGRVLSSYERYALKVLGLFHRSRRPGG